jgi:non-ribosomal peptide synthetase component F
MRDLEHASYSGVRVLRERVRRMGSGLGATMPVVFTSGFVSLSDDDDNFHFLGEEVYSVSQTPQVWLDHQVMTDRGELVITWDAVEALFPQHLLDDMFAVHRDSLDRLARDDGAWDDTGPLVSPPRWQIEERAAANDTAADIPARTLCELVEAQARRRPDEVAVVADDGRFTYGETAKHAHRLARRLAGLGAIAEHPRRRRDGQRTRAGGRRARDRRVGCRLPAGRPRVAAGTPRTAPRSGRRADRGDHPAAAS